MDSVVTSEVEVADGVVDLVEILLVSAVAGHSLKGLYLGFDVFAGIHFALFDSGVEFRAVGSGIAACCHAVGFVSEVAVSVERI